MALVLDGSVRLGRQEPRGAGWIRDARQLNEAAIQGWRVLRLTPAQIEDGSVFDLLARALAQPWRRA